MATLPLADENSLLGIHPKTLHSWLKQADVPLAAHPTDARIKCLTEEHIEQLARLHGRPLQLPATSRLASPQQQALPSSANEAEALQAVCPLPASFPQEADVIQKLSCLEARVGTLQEHLTQLALALLQAQEQSAQRRLGALETLTAELGGRLVFSPSLPEPPITGTRAQRACTPHTPGQFNPAEQLARSRLPPLIEYSAQGTYVIICSQEGEVHVEPDSPGWFEWLATISSFRFVGKLGRFSAYRDSDRQGPTRSWRAHRTIHQHRYQHSDGESLIT